MFFRLSRQVLAGVAASVGVLLPVAEMASAHAAQVPASTLGDSSTAVLAPKPVSYSTPGNYEFSVPKGVFRITTSLTGAGGGGGASHLGDGGGGGGGGATVRCTLNVHPGDRLSIHVAAGGTGGPHDGNGEDGDNSHVTVGKSTRAQANGGTGGQASLAGEGGAGGSGGTAALCGKGTHAKLHSGNPGTQGHEQRTVFAPGGPGGAPGKKVPSACPVGTGQGGDGGSGVGTIAPPSPPTLVATAVSS